MHGTISNDILPDNKKFTIAIVAGEHSGDHYGALIIAKLKERYPDCKFIGVGGSKMQAAGLQSLMPMDILSVIGIVNVIKKLPSLFKAKNKLVKDIFACKPDCFIGIDAPDFNLVVAKNLKKLAAKNNTIIKTIQYISPTIWAWRAHRINTVAKATDLVLCIFPFEAKLYHQKNIKATFVGHPLSDKLKPRSFVDKQNSLSKIHHDHKSVELVSGKTVIGLFPGSRVGELNSLATPFLNAASLLVQKNSNYYFVVPMVSQKLYDIWLKLYNDFVEVHGTDLPIKIIKTYLTGDTQEATITSTDVMQACDLILCKSGTTTLEAFLLNIPMVVAYKVSKLNELLIRLLIKVRFVAMPNILADKLFGSKIVPEFVQANVTAENLCNAITQELAKHQNQDTHKNWQQIQNYLKADNINHEHAVTRSIIEVINAN